MSTDFALSGEQSWRILRLYHLYRLIIGITLALGLWVYAGLAFNADPTGIWAMEPNLLNVFVSVVTVAELIAVAAAELVTVATLVATAAPFTVCAPQARH